MTTKTLILEATKELLWEQGYEAMSPRKVMDKADVGQGSLYHHFRSKAELAKAAMEEILSELKHAADEIFCSKAAPMDKIERYLLLPRDGTKGCRLGRLANDTSLLADPSLSDILTSYFQHLLDVITSTLLQSRIDMKAKWTSDDARTISMALVSSVQGGFILSKSLRDPDAIQDSTSGMTILIRNFLKN